MKFNNTFSFVNDITLWNLWWTFTLLKKEIFVTLWILLILSIEFCESTQRVRISWKCVYQVFFAKSMTFCEIAVPQLLMYFWTFVDAFKIFRFLWRDLNLHFCIFFYLYKLYTGNVESTLPYFSFFGRKPILLHLLKGFWRLLHVLTVPDSIHRSVFYHGDLQTHIP